MVLIREEKIRFILIFSKILENGVIKEAKNIPKIKGIKNDAPKESMTKTIRINKSI